MNEIENLKVLDRKSIFCFSFSSKNENENSFFVFPLGETYCCARWQKK